MVKCLLAIAIVVVAGCGSGTDTATSPDSGPAKSSAPKQLVFMTYNVLAEKVAVSQRLEALFGIMNENQPDVIALQEVTPWFFKELLDQPWVEKQYHGPSFLHAGSSYAPRGIYILSKYPIQKAEWTFLSGKSGRAAMVVQFEISGRTMMVATMHMQSHPEDGPIRAKQLDEIFALVATADDAVVLGDFNFGDGEAEENRIPSEYVDVWSTLHPNDLGYTWNIEKSEMAKKGSFPGESSRRIDRILLRSTAYEPSWIKIVGDKPLVEDQTLFPSDHFGLVGAVSREEDSSTN